MKNIIAELTANNQVVLRYVNRPNCLPPRNLGDLSYERDNEYVAKLVQKVEDINKVLANAHIDRNYENKRTYVQESIKTICQFIGVNTEYKLREDVSRYSVLELPEEISYVDIDGKYPVVVKTSTKDLLAKRQSHLDIIKKSQQRKKYVRSWGKLQADKTFTRNAKQKILEAGAVIDKHVGNTNAFALTLTIPGSGWDVYDVVSRWSGYIVNRLTQIIRRAEQKGCEVHWFYVWEHQKRGALHMHWCLAVESDWHIANLLCMELRGKWEELLEEFTVKTGIDLFKKRGFSGTWRYSPEVWQNDIFRVSKSVAQYFSKYCSKNAHVNKTNTRRRSYEKKNLVGTYDKANKARIYSLCPTRYWGCAMRTKRLCAKYRVTISFDVSSSREGNYVCEIIRKWLGNLSPELTEVSRSFKKTAPDTGFIYCSGWERKIWFSPNVIDDVVALFKRIRSNKERKIDSIGAMLDMDWF